jgi:hypothetical protein
MFTLDPQAGSEGAGHRVLARTAISNAKGPELG